MMEICALSIESCCKLPKQPSKCLLSNEKWYLYRDLISNENDVQRGSVESGRVRMKRKRSFQEGFPKITRKEMFAVLWISIEKRCSLLNLMSIERETSWTHSVILLQNCMRVWVVWYVFFLFMLYCTLKEACNSRS